MTDKELMQQALEALEGLADTSWTAAFKQREYDSDEPNENVERERVLGVITALRERLAQQEQKRPQNCGTSYCSCIECVMKPEQPETVMAEYKFQTYAAYKADGEMKIGVVPDDAPLTLNGVPLYPRREWVGLTDEECIAAIDEDFNFALDHGNVSDRSVIRYARAIEAKLKEKNA